MRKLVFLIAALALVLLVSGCTQQPPPDQTTCGNGDCGADETVDSCPADCESPPMPADQVAGENESPPSLPF